ncbi:single-strand DNA-binding protein [Algoriphagus ratkowskyi]|uniref:Single-stranded DNA-binding protein n=1 Tax=Algoriphagus ratkowskyi TaxID=57028 RepID=A0A2W7S5U9_9BACT|nr:single-stranded DNA-binding protein [Algoriphagus ratkowskyi]PZX58265.1 single-strand DNA-binding protein [Algoriphagus ratkowskyi]TXD77856.1 single-stranded DNA-binding protein [Algoriphagus ratkowskyi]
MAGVNKVILVGNLGSDPEIKYLEGDNAVANFSIATTEAYKNRNGERVEQTEWHDLEMWGAQAKIAEQYLKKGSQIYVEGKLKTDKWQDEQGQNRYRTKIRVLSFTMLGGKPDGATSGSPSATPQATQQKPASAAPTAAPKAQEMVTDAEDDDLPF